MIKQFNHVAFFVASMILLRDKPKHRARCLEKFMGIAVVRTYRSAPRNTFTLANQDSRNYAAKIIITPSVP